MFTGIVQHVGQIVELRPSAAGSRLGVDLGPLAQQKVQLGDSVCVSGVCLTVATLAGSRAEFDVVSETLRRTSLGQRRRGDQVNLELSLRPDSFLGGHFVQGHVDAVGTVAQIQNQTQDWLITVTAPEECRPLIVPKGSICVEGVSLTIAGVNGNQFTLAIIPTTLAATTLGALTAGAPVNIETDIVARTVVHYLALGKVQNPATAGLTFGQLREGGFV
ncbi:MAG: riboflavin synthase [Phycisphaerae bacterium]